MKNIEFFQTKLDSKQFIQLPVSTIEGLEKTGKRPAGYADDVKKESVAYDAKNIALTKEKYEELKNKYSPGIMKRAANVAGAALGAAASAVNTQILQRNRVSDEVFERRLNICKNCPSAVCEFRHGEPWTCGKMKDSMSGKVPTCGCVLKVKVRDATEACPLGHWTTEAVEVKA